MIADILGGQASAAVPKRRGLVAEVLAEERLKPPPPVPAPGRGLIGRILAEEGAKSTPAPLPVPASVAADAFPPPAVMPPSRTELPPNAIPAWLRATEWGLSNVVAPALEFGRIISPVTRLAAAGYKRWEPESTRVIREEMARADWGPRIPDWRFPEQVPLVGGQQVFPSQDVPVVGPYLGVGTQPLKTATELTGIGIMGPAFPLGFGMNAAAESLEGGRPLPEVLAAGLTAGMGAYMGGKALGLVGERLAPKNVVRVGDTWVRKEFAELAKRAMEQQEVTGGGPGIPAEWRPIGRLEALMGDQLRRTAQRIKDYFRERGREPAGREMRLAADAVMRGEAGARERLARAALRYNERGGRAFRDLMDYVVGPVAEAAPEPVLQLPPGAERGAALVPSRADLRVAVEQLGLTGLNLNALLRAIRKAGGDVAEGAAGLVGQKAAQALAARLAGAMQKPAPAPGPVEAEAPAEAATEMKAGGPPTDAREWLAQASEEFGPLTVSPRVIWMVTGGTSQGGRSFEFKEDARAVASKNGGEVEPSLYWSTWRWQEGSRIGHSFKTRDEAVASAKRWAAEDAARKASWEAGRQKATAAEAAQSTGKPQAKPRKAKPGITAQGISDFRQGIDRVERRGDSAYVVDTEGQRAPVKVSGDVLGPEQAANLRKLNGAQLDRMAVEVESTPYLSAEGKKERLDFIRQLRAPPEPSLTDTVGAPEAKAGAQQPQGVAEGAAGLIGQEAAQALAARLVGAMQKPAPAPGPVEAEGRLTGAAAPVSTAPKGPGSLQTHAAGEGPTPQAPLRAGQEPPAAASKQKTAGQVAPGPAPSDRAEKPAVVEKPVEKRAPAPAAVPAAAPLEPVPGGEPVPPVKTVSQAQEVRREARRLLEEYEEGGPGARHFTNRETYIGPGGKVTRHPTADLLAHEIAVEQDKPAVDAMTEGEIVEGILRQAERLELERAKVSTLPARLRRLAHTLTRDRPAVAADMRRVADQLDALRYANREELLEGEVNETKRQAREMVRERVEIERTVAKQSEQAKVEEVRRQIIERMGGKMEGVRAKAKLTRAELMEKLSERTLLRGAVRSALNQLEALKARHVGWETGRKQFKAAIERLPLRVRGKLLSHVLSAKTPEGYAHGLEQAHDYLEQYLRQEAAKGLSRIARVIYKHRQEMDPADYADIGATVEAVRSGVGLTQRGLDALEEQIAALTEAWHVHQNAKTLYTLQGMASAEDAARRALDELADISPAPGVESGAPTTETPRRSLPNRALDLNSHPDTVIEGNLGPQDGVLSRVLVDNVGRNATHHHYRDWYAVYDPMNEAAKAATGGALGSEKDIRWKSEPLTFKIGERVVTAERRHWLSLRGVLKDQDAATKWLARTESDNPEPATAVWSTRRGQVAFSFESTAEAYAWADGFDAKDPKAAAYVDRALAALNAPGRFEKADAIHARLFGTYLERVPGTRMPTRYNVAAEKQRPVPNFSEASPLDIVRHLGQHMARLPGGRGISMVLADFDNILLREAWEDGAFNAYGPPLRDAWTLMQQMVSRAGRPITFRAFLAERVGREVPQALDGHLRYIAQFVGLAYQTILDQAEVDPLLRRALHNAMGAAVGGFKWTTMANQLPAAALPLADTKHPMRLKDLAWALRNFISKARWAWTIIARERPDVRFRAELAELQQFLSPAVSSPKGYGQNRIWRLIKKAVAFTGRGAIRVDQGNRILQFLAAYHELEESGNLSGPRLENAAADRMAYWLYRSDAPLHPAYETPIGRAAKASTAVAAVTAFTKGRIANWNVVRRAIDQYRRDGDAKALAYRLAVAVLGMAAAFTGIGVLGSYLSGRTPGQGAGGVAGDFVENALGNTYGSTEIIRAIRAKSPFAVHVFSSPPIAAAERAAQGLIGLRDAIEKGSSQKALSASLKLLRGSASLAGIPTDQAVNLGRFIHVRAAVRAASRKEVVGGAKAAGEAKGAAEGEAGDRRLLAASGQGGGGERAVAALRATGMTLPAARTALRAAMRRAGIGFQERMERLRLLTSRWRGSGRRAA